MEEGQGEQEFKGVECLSSFSFSPHTFLLTEKGTLPPNLPHKRWKESAEGETGALLLSRQLIG